MWWPCLIASVIALWICGAAQVGRLRRTARTRSFTRFSRSRLSRSFGGVFSSPPHPPSWGGYGGVVVVLGCCLGRIHAPPWGCLGRIHAPPCRASMHPQSACARGGRAARRRAAHPHQQRFFG